MSAICCALEEKDPAKYYLRDAEKDALSARSAPPTCVVLEWWDWHYHVSLHRVCESRVREVCKSRNWKSLRLKDDCDEKVAQAEVSVFTSRGGTWVAEFRPAPPRHRNMRAHITICEFVKNFRMLFSGGMVLGSSWSFNEFHPTSMSVQGKTWPLPNCPGKVECRGTTALWSSHVRVEFSPVLLCLHQGNQSHDKENACTLFGHDQEQDMGHNRKMWKL